METKKKYFVTFEKVVEIAVIVEASDENEAEKLAYENATNEDICDTTLTLVSIEVD